jgi:hypothetical protein
MSELKQDVRVEDLMREVEAVVVRRVQDVERENERLRRRSTLALAGAVAALAMTAFALVWSASSLRPVAEAMEARRFVLRDANGLVRGAFELTPNGPARLVLQDQDGRERLKLTLLADGSPGLTFSDRDGRPRTVLGLLPDQTSTLVFADRAGATRAVFGLSGTQAPMLVLADRNGSTRAGLSIADDGSPHFTLFENEAPSPPAEEPVEAADSVAAAAAGPTEPAAEAGASRAQATRRRP